MPGLTDYPNHLMRVWLMSRNNATGSTRYVTRWLLIPKLAKKLIIHAVVRLVPVERAGGLFIRCGRAMLCFRRMGTVKKLAAVHGSIHHHFDQQ